MKNSVIVGCLMLLLTACCKHAETTFELALSGDDNRSVDIETADEREALTFQLSDSLRKASFGLSLAGGEYARLWVGDLPFLVWVENEKPWSAELKWNELHFKGPGEEINSYLNTRFVHQFYFNDYYRMEDAEFRGQLQKVIGEWEKVLQERELDTKFVEREKKRLQWLRNYHLASFAVGAISRAEPTMLSGESEAELQLATLEDTGCWGIPEYPETIKRILQAIAQRDTSLTDAYSRLLCVLKMATENYKDQRLVEFLVNKSVMEYIRLNGMENTTEMDRVFRGNVHRPEYVAAYNEMYEANRSLFKGQPAIAFTLPDTTGKMVSLSDFRGKYVYIDMWATWCGPCRAQIPHLEALEKRLEGKNICFVSISCDNGQKEWKRYVKDHQLKGVQLYLGYDKEFMKSIQCNGIPRFILIDPEGNYVNANMSRPSEAETLKILESLPGL